MSVRTKVFGTMKDGHKVTLYSIQNQNGMIVEVMDYGAILVNLLVPDHSQHDAHNSLGIINMLS